MNRLLIIILYCCVSSGALAQSYYKTLKNHSVTMTEDNQTIVFYTNPIKNDILIDPYKTYVWYSSNQINYTQGGFSGKLLNGLYTSFFLNKNLKEQGNFNKGLRNGYWKQWYDNGNLKDITLWKSGLKTGRFTQFDEKGAIIKTGKLSKGELDGKITSYYEKDSTSIVRYKKGKQQVEKEDDNPGFINRVKTFFKNLFRSKKSEY